MFGFRAPFSLFIEISTRKERLLGLIKFPTLATTSLN